MCVRLINKLHYQFKRRYKRKIKILKEIHRYQKSIDLFISKVSFARLIKEILYNKVATRRLTIEDEIYYRIQTKTFKNVTKDYEKTRYIIFIK